MATTKVKFGEPPPGRTTTHDWGAIAAALRKRPGEWAEVFKDDRYSLVAAISNDSMAAFRTDASGHFETRSTNNHSVEEADGVVRRHCDLWMRFVPNEKKGKRATPK